MSGGGKKPKQTPTPVNPSNNYAGFFASVLKGLGVPESTGSLLGLADVVNTEGVNNYYNPFNIEWHAGDNTAWQGTGNYNKVGVQEYGSKQQGVDATVAYLKDNPHWAGVVAALKTGDKTQVDNALTAAYTWAHFNPASTNNDYNILASNLGTHSTNVQNPGGVLNDIGKGVGSVVDTGKSVVGGAISTGQALGKVGAWIAQPDNWIKIGFIAAGFIALLIGIDKLTDGGISGSVGGNAPETVTRAATNPAKTTKDAATSTADKVADSAGEVAE